MLFAAPQKCAKLQRFGIYIYTKQECDQIYQTVMCLLPRMPAASIPYTGIVVFTVKIRLWYILNCTGVIAEDDEAIQCEWKCKKWLHRYCAGISKSLSDEFANCANPFSCFYCVNTENKKIIQGLRNEVALLRTEISELKTSLAAVISSGSVFPCKTASVSTTNIPGNIRGETMPNASVYSSVVKSSTFPSMPTSIPLHPKPSPEKKLNIVLYGVDECAPGMSRSARQESDLSTVAAVFSSLDSSISSQSIRDCLRLGKFSSESRPRPID